METLLAPALDNWVAIALIALSFLSSTLTAAAGAGGGLLMLGAMSAVMPAAAVIPVHGIVQLGSNGGRAVLARRHIAWPRVTILLAGAVPGALLGSLLLLRLPPGWLELCIALFITLMVWFPQPRIGTTSTAGIASFGLLASFLSLFVGATGPIVSAYIQRLGLNRHEVVATAAASICGLNVGKLVVFGLVGFDWRGWLLLALLMIGSGLAGTWLGLRLLGQLSENVFRSLIRWLLSALALELAWRALRLIW